MNRMDPVLEILLYRGEVADSGPEVADPIGNFIELTEADAFRKRNAGTDLPLDAIFGGPQQNANLATLEKATVVQDLSWDAPLTASVSRGKPSTFAKGTRGHELGIVRVEEQESTDGEKWMHGFNAAGELVDAHVVMS